VHTPGAPLSGFLAALENAGNLNPLVYQERAGRSNSPTTDWNPSQAQELPAIVQTDLGPRISGLKPPPRLSDPVPEGPLRIARRFQRRVAATQNDRVPLGTPEIIPKIYGPMRRNA
jgi:hypothetical protein